MIAYIKQMRRKVNVPISTAEPWHVWLKHPELANSVDYITVHLLPYWEGVPVEDALATSSAATRCSSAPTRRSTS